MMDRRFIRSSVIVGVAQISARALGIIFSFAVAKLYSAAAFGEVRYLIALSAILIIPTAALPRTLSRFVTKHRATGRQEADQYFSNSLVLLTGSGLIVAILATVVMLVTHTPNIGFVALCVGLSIFAVYFDLLRAVERFSAMAIFYISANILQLLAVLTAAFVHVYSVTLVLLAYGLSSLPPLLCIELWKRSPVTFHPRSLTWPVLRELARFSAPLLLAHTAYIGWFNLDIVLVERLLGLQAAANYALSKTIAMVFVFVPYATTTVVLPRFVHAEQRNGGAYLRVSLLASALASLFLLAAISIIGTQLIHVAFHHKYPTAPLTLLPLSIGMAAYSLYLVLETWVVGAGKPLLHAWSMTLTAALTLGGDLILIPHHGPLGAAVAFAGGALSGLLALAILARRNRSSPRPLTGLFTPSRWRLARAWRSAVARLSSARSLSTGPAFHRRR